MDFNIIIMKTLIVIPLLSVFTLFPISPKDSTYVYICKGPYSKAYHLTKVCEGLKNCSTVIDSLTINKVEGLERRLCGYEREKSR